MRFFCILILILSLSVAVFAQQTQSGTVSLSLTDSDVTEALANLSQKANVSILGDATVKGKVSCSLSDVTVEQALDTICKMNKLEWYKTYAKAGAEDKPTASKLFKLLDAIKELGGAAVICSDPTAKTQTVFIPGMQNGAVDTNALAASMKLKEVYIVRAIPVPVEKTEAAKVALGNAPIGDTSAAVDQLYNYFQQMPLEQQFNTMHDLRNKFYESMTPEQRDQMRNYFRQQWQNNSGGRSGPDGNRNWGPGSNRGDGNRGDGNRGSGGTGR